VVLSALRQPAVSWALAHQPARTEISGAATVLGMLVRTLMFTLLVLASHAVAAETYQCRVTQKIDGDHRYSPEELSRGQFSVLIELTSAKTLLQRCSFSPSVQRVTCDSYSADRAEKSETVDGSHTFQKFYVFRSQLDVQLFKPSMTFVENNGRGGVAWGTCEVKK